MSILLDILYGTLPTPFFVDRKSGNLAPEIMMNKIPGTVLIILAVMVAFGISFACNYALQFVPLVPEQSRDLIAKYALIPVCVHWAIFLGHAIPFKSDILFDITCHFAFVAMSLTAANDMYNANKTLSTRSQFVIYIQILWSIRLGLFLLYRILERKNDFRFEQASKNHKIGYLFFSWTFQGIWCFLQGLAMIMMFDVHYLKINGSETNNKVVIPDIFTRYSDYLGFTIFIVGLATETISDLQKLDFVRKYPNREERPWIESGFWYYSRHPNYCGETMVWLGVFILCLPTLFINESILGVENWRVLPAIFSVTFSAIFLMQTSVPWLEEIADRKFGDKEEYQRYKRTTSAYLILPKRS